MPNGMKVFGGSANPKLTRDICNVLGISPGAIKLKRFADGELFPEIQENVRGCDIFIIQPTCASADISANDNLMELLLMVDAFKRSSAESITAVLPYYGYARQDRKDRPRVPISAAAVANMIEGSGVDRMLTMDLHSAPIQGFFKIPVDHMYALPVFLDYIKALDLDNLAIVSPDAGGVARARLASMKLGVPLAIVDKYREAANVSEVMNVIGDVSGKNCIMIDDMIDTAGTLVKGAKALLDRGAKSVRAAASHGLFSYDKKNNISAHQRIDESSLVEVIVADTIPQKSEAGKKVTTLSVATMLGNAIAAIQNETSVSSLFV
jgi:ribose-phosphate pyrophosphokinase